jgi:hypothetical protein
MTSACARKTDWRGAALARDKGPPVFLPVRETPKHHVKQAAPANVRNAWFVSWGVNKLSEPTAWQNTSARSDQTRDESKLMIMILDHVQYDKHAILK